MNGRPQCQSRLQLFVVWHVLETGKQTDRRTGALQRDISFYDRPCASRCWESRRLPCYSTGGAEEEDDEDRGRGVVGHGRERKKCEWAAAAEQEIVER